MSDQKRDPHADNELIEDDLPTPTQGGSAGGGMQREIGALDEERTATGADPQPTSVHKARSRATATSRRCPTASRHAKVRIAPRRGAVEKAQAGAFVEWLTPFAEPAACPFFPVA